MDTRYQFVKQQYHFQKKLTDKEREKARKLRDEQQAYQCNLATEKVKQQYHFQKKLTDKEREKARKLRDELHAYLYNVATEKVKRQHHVKQTKIKVSKSLYPPGINKLHVSSF